MHFDPQLLPVINFASSLWQSDAVQNAISETVQKSIKEIGEKTTAILVVKSADAVKSSLENVEASFKSLFGRNSEVVSQIKNLKKSLSNSEQEKVSIDKIQQEIFQLDFSDKSIQEDMTILTKRLQELTMAYDELKALTSKNSYQIAMDASVIINAPVTGNIMPLKMGDNSLYIGTQYQTTEKKK